MENPSYATMRRLENMAFMFWVNFSLSLIAIALSLFCLFYCSSLALRVPEPPRTEVPGR